jgi:hypothetical protein
MKRHRSILSHAARLCVLAAFVVQGLTERPNIIVILTDDQGD